MLSIFDTMLRFSYATDLHKHLKGMDLECETFTSASIYELMMWVTAATTLLFVVNYYKGFLHRPKFTGRLAWLINLLIACGIVFMVAYFRTRSDLTAGNVCEDLHFNDTDIILFGLTAASYAFLFGLLLSFALKYFSIHHRRIPV